MAVLARVVFADPICSLFTCAMDIFAKLLILVFFSLCLLQMLAISGHHLDMLESVLVRVEELAS